MGGKKRRACASTRWVNNASVGLPLGLFQQAPHVADCKQPSLRVVAGVGVIFADHRGDVVGAHHYVVVDGVLIGLHRREHIVGALVVPRLDEVVGVAFDVPEVDKVDAVAEPPDRLRKVDTHRGEVALAERDAVVLAVVAVEDTLVRLGAVDDSGNPAQRLPGRVVRMEAELHPSSLRDWRHLSQEVLQRVPDLLARDVDRRFRLASVHPVVRVRGHHRATAGLDVGLRACPADPDHPVVADDRDVELSTVPDKLLELLDVLVAPLLPEPDAVSQWDAPLDDTDV